MQEELCPIEDCDVEDKIGLCRYRMLRSKCIDSLVGDRHNSVQAQLRSMIARQAFFEAVEITRKNSTDRRIQSALHSGALQDFMDAGYVATQAMAFRRLVDTSRDVNSLVKILNWIESDKKILKREMFICWDGVVYDEDEVVSKAKLDDSGFIDGSFCRSIIRHGKFDDICGIQPDNRRRYDTISKEKIAEMKKKIETTHINDARLTAKKFIAHAVIEADREDAVNGLTRKQIDVGLSGLVQAGYFVARLFEISFLIDIPDFGIATNLEFPLIPAELKNDFNVKWSKMMSKYQE